MATEMPPTVDEALSYAVEAIERGNVAVGKAALGWVLQREPDNPQAWLWMACCVPDEGSKRGCYLRVSR
jgi:hypothetical protein